MNGSRGLMSGLAIVAILWAVVRACHQSITMDESATFRAFVGLAGANHWAPHSNNHVLNSLLMRLSTTVFGISELSVRLPALAGGCLYIGSCYALCQRMIRQWTVRVVVFACLIFNPFLADFYVAARGYSFAFGSLVAAMAAVARVCMRLDEEEPVAAERAWVWASALLGLSFVANFSFAFIDLAMWAGLFLWTLSMRAWKTGAQLGRLVAASTVPGLLVVAGIASWTLLHWPEGQLFDGTRSLAEMFRSVARASLHEPNGEVASPPVLGAVQRVRRWLIPALCVVGFWQALRLLARWPHLRMDPRVRRRVELLMVVTGALGCAALLHWAAYQLFGMLMPRNRMASWIVPLWTVAAGLTASIVLPGRVNAAGRRVVQGLLCVLAVYYAACLRTSYFYEWWVDADGKEVYYALAYLNHRYEVRDVASMAPMADNLEFYRRASGGETFGEFRAVQMVPAGKDAYVLYESATRDLIERQHLKIVYRGRRFSDVVVAIRPDLRTQGAVGPLGVAEAGTFYDDTDWRVIQFHGDWKTDYQFREPENGSVTYSNRPGDAFLFRFRGTGVRWVFTKAGNRGTAEVFVDGVRQGKVEQYSARTEWRRSAVFDGFSEGEHVLEARVAGNGYVDVDGLRVVSGR